MNSVIQETTSILTVTLTFEINIAHIGLGYERPISTCILKFCNQTKQ